MHVFFCRADVHSVFPISSGRSIGEIFPDYNGAFNRYHEGATLVPEVSGFVPYVASQQELKGDFGAALTTINQIGTPYFIGRSPRAIIEPEQRDARQTRFRSAANSPATSVQGHT